MDLKQILRGHAVILLERKSTKAILSDVFNNDMPKVNALMSAYDIGIVKTIQEHFPLGNLDRSNAINKLIKQHSMLEAIAVWAVDQWVAAIDNTIIMEMKAAQDEKDKERLDQLFVGGEDSGENPELPSSHGALSDPLPIDFTDKSEQVDYYTNVRLDKTKGKIYIPCGVGNTDNGFYICGINEKVCSHAETFSNLV